MPIESPFVTSYLMAIVMFVPSVIISDIFAIELCMTSTLSARIGQGQIQK